jgi:hypothetical protein
MLSKNFFKQYVCHDVLQVEGKVNDLGNRYFLGSLESHYKSISMPRLLAATLVTRYDSRHDRIPESSLLWTIRYYIGKEFCAKT